MAFFIMYLKFVFLLQKVSDVVRRVGGGTRELNNELIKFLLIFGVVFSRRCSSPCKRGASHESQFAKFQGRPKSRKL